jgi:hypothetical protein
VDTHHQSPSRNPAVLQAAEEASGTSSGGHHFTTIQLPGNVFETVGLEHAAKWAAAQGLNVLVNRPLNAFTDHSSFRLADYPYNGDAYAEAFGKADRYLAERGESSRQLREAVQAMHEQRESIPSVFAYEARFARQYLPELRAGVSALEV